MVRRSRKILVLTGAGVSAESGVPTFRGENGLWKRYRAQDLATPQAFGRDPRLVWEWYAWRREKVGSCTPNPAHRAVARLALAREGVSIVTQNVDGLHEVAALEEVGSPREGADEAAGPAFPVELHGSLFRVRCTACGERYGHREPVDASGNDTLPSCRSCGGLLRPDVVWFGESLEEEVLEEAFTRAREAELCLVVGTSALVQPAASLPLVTRSRGGRIVEVNPETTPLTASAAVALRGAAGSVLPPLVEGGLGEPEN